ncbi:MAG: VOC family protein [Thermomicrobiales bacterium]|nr:VOC family protein [Thermomicrobiales bacterium]MCO5219684.1 VOC family protein [Thermomicrobiales bacterium]MCO5225830.1 VOC family protein [Thermomicrobiales bacterium]MCO5226532.1 VOC family protein [Thermomicrobiales bacterium]MCO5228387.1 VOC family protein [Thermomicrobiales bacterium]
MAAPKPPHGKILYMLLPATDAQTSATFYSEVFGWNLRETHQGISFDDSVNQVHGRFTEQLSAVDNPGAIIYIMVRDAAETEERIAEFGGQVLDPANRDKEDILGTFRDPAGNLFGFYEMQEGDEG